MRIAAPFASIRPRLALLILLAMTALGVVLIYQEFQKHATDKKHADENLLRLTNFAAHAERERFDAAERLLVLAQQGTALRNMALAPDSKENFDKCTSGLFVLDQLLPETSGFALWDPSGRSLCSSKGATPGQYSVRDRLWFQTATERQGIATGAFELAPPDDQPSLGFGEPIRDAQGQKIIAYLSTGLKLDQTDELLAGSNLPDTGRIGIVDQNGIIINSTNGLSGQPAEAFNERFGSLRTFGDSRIADGSGGRRAAAVRITDEGDAAVTMAIGAEKSALVTPLAQTLARDLWPVALLTLVTLLAVWFLAQRWVLRPVEALVRASDALAHGKLGARADVRTNISEFEQLGTAFNEMAAKSQAANQAKDDFLGLVSHELKTPITIVMGNAVVLRSRAELLNSEQRRAALDDIEQSALRLTAIIDNMLALARLDRGVALEKEPLSLFRMAQQTAQARAAREDREVLVRGEPTLMAMGSEIYVEQVLQNLVANAIKYSPQHSPVEVMVQRQDEMALVRIIDAGEGVEDEDRDAIFTPFYRSARTSALAEGVGIGLSVCKRLVDAMGGRIWTEDVPAGGCEFGFSLPVALELDEAELADEPAHEDAPLVAALDLD